MCLWRYPTIMLYNGNTMSKRQILMLLGVWIAIFLFLGFYSAWDKIIAIITGVLVIGISYSLKPEGTSRLDRGVPFVEHKSGPSSSDFSAEASKSKEDSKGTQSQGTEIPAGIMQKDITSTASSTTQ